MANYLGRCYVATSTSSRDMCKFDNNRQWIGKARTGSNRVPVKTVPVARKRGFSGYGEKPTTCTDAAALGLENSWYYTWMTRASKGAYDVFFFHNYRLLRGSSGRSTHFLLSLSPPNQHDRQLVFAGRRPVGFRPELEWGL